ncbi:MAG: hypothetical protein J1E83_01675 [Lachnospiraceae bacterium]|nr:hypothetical protein [Lachnospiraceae bacterium]
MKGKKRILFGIILLLAVNLCGCSNDSNEQQIVGGFSITEGTLQDNMPGSELAEKTEAIEEESLETIPDLKELMYGGMGNLGLGFLVYTIPDRDNEDYRLYFFQSEKEEDRYLPFEEMSFHLSEASFVFPDVREGNVPIGKFKEIYFMDYADVLKDGSNDVIVIAVYEKDGNEYYDTRVYEERESGFVINVVLTQKLNEKYYDVEEYPVWEIVTLPGESDVSDFTEEQTIPLESNSAGTEGFANEYTIEGFAFADGMERSVCITLSVESIIRGEEAFKILQEYDTNISHSNEKEEYIIINFNVSYDSGEIEELYMMENRASLEQAGLYFALSNSQSNAYDVTSYLGNSIYDLSLTKGQSAQGAVAFLQEKGNTEPLVFVGFEQIVKFNISD